MDMSAFWNGCKVAIHVSRAVSPHLPGDTWLLAHELSIILVRGSGTVGESLGAVSVSPVAGSPDEYRECLDRVLDELQDLVVGAINAPWPGSGGVLRSCAKVEGATIRSGYARAVGDLGSEDALTLPPFELGGRTSSSVRVGG